MSRLAPVFDPATRTAEMEIEVPNPGYRLKPGMCPRRADGLSTARRDHRSEQRIITVNGKPGLFIAGESAAGRAEAEVGQAPAERRRQPAPTPGR